MLFRELFPGTRIRWTHSRPVHGRLLRSCVLALLGTIGLFKGGSAIEIQMPRTPGWSSLDPRRRAGDKVAPWFTNACLYLCWRGKWPVGILPFQGCCCELWVIDSPVNKPAETESRQKSPRERRKKTGKGGPPMQGVAKHQEHGAREAKVLQEKRS